VIVWQGTAQSFKDDVDSNQMLAHLEAAFRKNLHRNLPSPQIGAFTNSLQFMSNVVRRSEVAADCSILIEYMIPLTSKQIDFLIAGEDANGKQNMIIIELKQWQTAEATEAAEIVHTPYYGDNDTPHPSYQANSYKDFISDFNENIGEDGVAAYACAYLHNFDKRSPEPLVEGSYAEIVKKAPIYFRQDQDSLEAFMAQHVGKGRGRDIIYELESGRIRPTKKLIDHVSSMYTNNSTFTLLDEQKVAFERAKAFALKQDRKYAVIIKGGPGTGKSVISVNLLGALLKEKLNTVFVAPNSSFRTVMVKRLAKEHSSDRINMLFKGSGNYVHAAPNTYDCLVVDEAHRLKKKGAYMYQGQNQVEDIIKAAKTSVFFIDDDQAIRPEDVGSVAEIKRVAEEQDAEIYEIELTAQFRCSGAEGYVNWVNDVLHLKQTGNYDGWDDKDFDFKLFDDPNDLHRAIIEKDAAGFDARMLAGYAWKWSSASEGNNNAEIEDVVFPEYKFRMPWNSRKVGTTWAVDQSGLSQVGCIHTSQGLEFDYVGVIIGNDLTFNSETLTFNTDYNSYKDATGKRGLKDNPKELNRLVRNIYKVLLTRGMKGCYVYAADRQLGGYLRLRLKGE